MRQGVGGMPNGEDLLHNSISQMPFGDDRGYQFVTSSVSAVCLRQAYTRMDIVQRKYTVRARQKGSFRYRVSDDGVVPCAAVAEVGSDAPSLSIHSAFQLHMDI